jgi:hypothetical protein
MFMKVLWSTEALFVGSRKELQLPKQKKAKLHDLPCSGDPVRAVSSGMLQCADIIHKNKHTTTQQLTLSLSISKQHVTSFEILDI